MPTTRIAITGANSAVGNVLLTEIANTTDTSAVAIVRREGALKGLPTGPSVTTAVARYEDSAALRAALDGVSCVVHLAGILFESRTTTYQSANVETTRALVEAATDTGVRHLVFISSIGADPASPNGYFRSKGVAEALVTGADFAGTAIRTPLLLGPETAGGRALVRTASQGSTKTLGGGTHTLRPLDIDDLSAAILAATAQDQPADRSVHDLVGPTGVTYRALIEQMASLLGKDVSVGSTPIWLAKLGAGAAGLFRQGGMTPDVIDVITSSEDVPHNADGDLSIMLTPVANTLQKLVQA